MKEKIFCLIGGLIVGAGGATLFYELVGRKKLKAAYARLDDATMEYMEARAECDKTMSEFNQRKPMLVLEAMNEAAGYIAHEDDDKDDISENTKDKKGGEVIMAVNEISAARFQDDDEYEKEYLTLYADNVLADDNDNIIFAEDHVGFDAIDDMDVTPGTTMYIRNNGEGVDYCITRHKDTFRVATGLPYTGGSVDYDDD